MADFCLTKVRLETYHVRLHPYIGAIMVDDNGEKKYISGLAAILPEDVSQDPAFAYFVPPKSKKYPVEWLTFWKTPSDIGVGLMEQALSENLTLSDYRIRDYLIGSIGIGNYVFVNQREVARKLNLNKSTVNESIKKLLSLKIIIAGPKSGRSNTYMINPAFCFFGSLDNGVKARKETINKAKVLKFDGGKK